MLNREDNLACTLIGLQIGQSRGGIVKWEDTIEDGSQVSILHERPQFLPDRLGQFNFFCERLRTKGCAEDTDVLGEYSVQVNFAGASAKKADQDQSSAKRKTSYVIGEVSPADAVQDCIHSSVPPGNFVREGGFLVKNRYFRTQSATEFCFSRRTDSAGDSMAEVFGELDGQGAYPGGSGMDQDCSWVRELCPVDDIEIGGVDRFRE